MKENKTKEVDLNEVLKQVEGQFGKGSLMLLDDVATCDCDVISSGSILLDEALGVKGYPRGRIVEIYGPESSGKTTLALTAVAEVQKNDGRCAYIDAENSIDPDYAKKIGVKIDELVISQPDSGEQAFEIVEMLAKSEAFDLIVIDSVAALVPQSELDGMMSDNSVGVQARMMSKALRKISGVLNKTKTTIIFINQLREKIGVIYGNNETTTGGRALKFYSSVRIDIRRQEAIKDGSAIIGNTVNIKVVKNKVAPPFRGCKLDIIYGQGISREGEALDLGVQYELIKKAGAWYEINGDRMGQGRETAKQFLREHPEILEKLQQDIREKISQKSNKECK